MLSVSRSRPCTEVKSGDGGQEAMEQESEEMAAKLPELHSACLSRDLQGVRRCLAQGYDIYGRHRGDTPLHCLLVDLPPSLAGPHPTDSTGPPGSRYELVCVLLDAGADVNSVGQYGATPLHLACVLRDSELVRLLIRNGANVNALDRDGETTDTPLLRVFRGKYTGGRERMFRLDLDKSERLKSPVGDVGNGFNFGNFGNGLTFSKFGNMSVVGNAGNAVNCSSPGDASRNACGPAEVARCTVEVVRALLDAGADVNVPHPGRQSPLHYACSWGHDIIIALLLERGADARARNARGETPLHCLVKTPLPCLLGESGPGGVPQSRTVNTVLGSTLAAVLGAGCDVTARTREGCTPLHYACAWSDRETVSTLLSHGADTSATDQNGDTALHRLVGPQVTGIKIDILTLLLQTGADIEAQNASGKTPLLSVCYEGDYIPELVECLVAGGADTTAFHTSPEAAHPGEPEHSYFHQASCGGGARHVRRLCDLGFSLPTDLYPLITQTPLTPRALTPAPPRHYYGEGEDLAVAVRLCQAGMDCTEWIHQCVLALLPSFSPGSPAQVNFFSRYARLALAVNPYKRDLANLLMREVIKNQDLGPVWQEQVKLSLAPASLLTQTTHSVRSLLRWHRGYRSILPRIEALGEEGVPRGIRDILKLSGEVNALLAALP